jgi:hypothetical protein
VSQERGRNECPEAHSGRFRALRGGKDDDRCSKTQAKGFIQDSIATGSTNLFSLKSRTVAPGRVWLSQYPSGCRLDTYASQSTARPAPPL